MPKEAFENEIQLAETLTTESIEYDFLNCKSIHVPMRCRNERSIVVNHAKIKRGSWFGTLRANIVFNLIPMQQGDYYWPISYRCIIVHEKHFQLDRVKTNKVQRIRMNLSIRIECNRQQFKSEE